jgi:hypothetical protein
MKIKHQVLVFDAAALAAESEFWAGLLGQHGRHRAVPRAALPGPRCWTPVRLEPGADVAAVTTGQIGAV